MSESNDGHMYVVRCERRRKQQAHIISSDLIIMVRNTTPTLSGAPVCKCVHDTSRNGHKRRGTQDELTI